MEIITRYLESYKSGPEPVGRKQWEYRMGWEGLVFHTDESLFLMLKRSYSYASTFSLLNDS